ncbi:MAG TPA: heme exporter protein CcmD [Gammaproteobacteria bacterium]|nr:heme exporter protein CcmD [Gammaproteobacteria bacterium]
MAAGARGGCALIDFLQMGGYAAYVWSAYGITLAVILFNIWAARRARRLPLERAAHAVGEEDRPRRRPTVRQVQ